MFIFDMWHGEGWRAAGGRRYLKVCSLATEELGTSRRCETAHLPPDDHPVWPGPFIQAGQKEVLHGLEHSCVCLPLVMIQARLLACLWTNSVCLDSPVSHGEELDDYMTDSTFSDYTISFHETIKAASWHSPLHVLTIKSG